jgi:hypothetical protein
MGKLSSELDCVQRDACIAICESNEHPHRFWIYLNARRAGAAKSYGLDVGIAKRLQNQDSATRQQRSRQTERRILRRRADKRQGAVLNKAQQEVLLRPCEVVNLIQEQDRWLRSMLRFTCDLLDLGDTSCDRAPSLKMCVCMIGDEPGKRRLPASGGSPQNYRA